MSDKPISVGDLVMVVRTCCQAATERAVKLGLPWRVADIRAPIRNRCPGCGKEAIDKFVVMEEPRKGWSGSPLSWLKRIDPDALNDDVLTREELTA